MRKQPGEHRFVFYGDACSGRPDHPHRSTFAQTNAVIAAREPTPDFVIFAGDEIAGLTPDEDELRRQWRFWFDVEMAWLDRNRTPLYNTTSNHTTYDVMSERVFSEMCDHLPRNGPPDRLGLAYSILRDDLLIVFVHTCDSSLGGEGHVDTAWLEAVLSEHGDVPHKLVVGHHPVFPVNGFSGEYQRELGHAAGQRMWDIFVERGVCAYLCSHILAFDVQVHRGVLQIVSAGAGTAHRMPEEHEYLHFVDMIVGDAGLRCQVIDQSGFARESLRWPAHFDTGEAWDELDETPVRLTEPRALRLTGRSNGTSGRETLVSSVATDGTTGALWIGLTGPRRTLTVTISPAPGRSPHYWLGPEVGTDRSFDLELGLHPAMGPGGVMWRRDADAPWSSLTAASPWGLEVAGMLHIVNQTNPRPPAPHELRVCISPPATTG